jgi:hypothetical protein
VQGVPKIEVHRLEVVHIEYWRSCSTVMAQTTYFS